jgi:hypothetical protein
MGKIGSGHGSFTTTYVSDSGNNRIQKFDSNGKFITKWGSPGSGDGQFGGPVGVAVDSILCMSLMVLTIEYRFSVYHSLLIQRLVAKINDYWNTLQTLTQLICLFCQLEYIHFELSTIILWYNCSNRKHYC